MHVIKSTRLSSLHFASGSSKVTNCARQIESLGMRLQLSVVIRLVSDECEIHEDPIGFVHLLKTDAAMIFGALYDVLLWCILL